MPASTESSAVSASRIYVSGGVSRGTIWRLLQTARKKVAQALTEGRALAVTNEANYPVKRWFLFQVDFSAHKKCYLAVSDFLVSGVQLGV